MKITQQEIKNIKEIIQSLISCLEQQGEKYINICYLLEAKYINLNTLRTEALLFFKLVKGVIDRNTYEKNDPLLDSEMYAISGKISYEVAVEFGKNTRLYFLNQILERLETNNDITRIVYISHEVTKNNLKNIYQTILQN